MRKRKARRGDLKDPNPRGLYGGRVDDFPQPVTWYWPEGVAKRKVDCQIISWVESLGPIAEHYYAHVHEEDNYAWDGTRWCQPWGGPRESKGRQYDKQFLSHERATRYINLVLRFCFSPKTHELTGIYEAPARPGAYLFWKDGD